MEIFTTAIVAVLGTLFTQAVIGAVKRYSARRDDSIQLNGTLSISGSTMESMGCPALELKVTCASNRPAKIQRAALWRRGFDLAPAIQAGMGNLGHTPLPKSVGPPPSTGLVFFKGAEQASSELPVVLERDDAYCFYLPPSEELMVFFVQAPSEDVSVQVELVDGNRLTVARGASLQSTLRGFMAVTLGRDYQLKPWVVTKVCVESNSLTAPNFNMVGKENKRTIKLKPSP